MTSPPPVSPSGSAEVRKTVTVVFSDLVESTLLGGQLDPETLRHVMSRYFESMRVVLERHGGTLEKYIGDAIMAVFGVPVLHEDDALRAVRAAAEMRDALASLNDELERSYGLRLAARIGVNTGEVIAGDPSQGHLIVTGRAVNVAKRLEEAAGTSEILIGETTRLLVRNAALLEPVDAPPGEGATQPRAWRLLGVMTGAQALPRRLDAPLVGRRLELTILRQAFDRSAGGRTGHLATVLGSAGVGKSRLVNELVGQIGDGGTVLKGRCLPYGEGITYWPLGEVLRESVGLRGRSSAEESVATIARQLEGVPNARRIAERVADTLGVAGRGAGTSEETFWAVRKLFEALARTRPLVVVFEDLHWAEPTFLDLVDYVADSRDSPLLVLCVARPELLDDRPTWGGGKPNASTILLEPLGEVERRELIGNLLAGVPVAADAEDRIAEAAEGNPLFTEELVTMLVDHELLKREGDRWITASHLSELPVPPSIQTLLAARVERLPEDERALLTRASVEGAGFHRTAAAELTLDIPADAVEPVLAALVRKDLIRPDRTSFAGDDAYRFRHVLIRDAAYRSLPKGTRAELHERFAAWLERAAEGRLREFEEIVGYHLEQAYRYRLELTARDAKAQSLVEGAARRLESAGRRAVARGDLPAATGLLERVSSLLSDDDRRRAALLPELGAALIEAGRLAEAEHVLDEARALAMAVEDERAESHALVLQQFLRLLRAPEAGTDEAARTVERVIPVFESCDDQHGLCRARRLEAWLHHTDARAGAAIRAWEQAAEHARRAGDEDEQSEILSWVASSIFFGPVPVADGIRRCEEIRVEVGGNLASEAATLQPLAGLYAMDGQFEVARELLATSAAVFDELGMTLNSAVSHHAAIVELLAGNAPGAEASLEAGVRALERMGEKALLSTTAAYLAQAILAQGRDAEAERFSRLSEELAAPSDLLTQVLWRGTRARLLARRGEVEEGERLAREAVAIAERTDFLDTSADALLDLAVVLQQAGRLGKARKAAAEALGLYERKGNAVSARKIRADLAVLLHA